MDGVCVKCARLSIRSHRSLHSSTQAASLRTFTTSLRNRAEEPPKSRESGSSAPVQQRRTQPNRSAGTAPSINAPPRGTLLIRRVVGSSPTEQPARSNGPPQGNLLRRSGPPSQAGQLLRRTGPPQQGVRRSGSPGSTQVQKGKLRRRRTAESVKAEEDGEEPASEEAIEEYMTKYINRPENPTERLDYNPKPQPIDELQKDWPNTPMSSRGLTASVTQKIEWVARRLPHGFQAPEHLAEQFHKGYLTRFESEEEKQKVLKLASELAQQRAAKLSERKGSDVAAQDMGISDLSTREDKDKLIDQTVKGNIGELEKQRMPFLDSIMRNLRNNETYQQPEMEKFMSTIQRLMPAQTQRRPQQQVQQKKA